MKQRDKLLNAFKRGEKLTSYSAAKRGITVDLRKYVSTFKKEGYVFHSPWSDGVKCKRHKIYFLDKVRTPKKLL